MTSRKKLQASLEMLHSVDRGRFFIFFAAIVSDCIIYGEGRNFSEDVMIFVGYDLPPLVFIRQTNRKILMFCCLRGLFDPHGFISHLSLKNI